MTVTFPSCFADDVVSQMFGLLNLNKPAWMTSRDAVNKVQRMLPRRTRIGHAGTLDPMATGVLVLCIGPATRLVPYIQDQTKSYRAGFRLGCSSNTDDSRGTITETVNPPEVSDEQLLEALKKFQGTIQQLPPQFSALHVNGQRAYDLARAGKQVELAPREVTIPRIELVERNGFDLVVEIDCGSGTYIRSIARDLGEALGTGGLMTSLLRSGIGVFQLENSMSLEDLNRDNIASQLQNASIALPDHVPLTISEPFISAVMLGKSLPASLAADTSSTSQDWKIVSEEGQLLAIAERMEETGRIQPRMVFKPGATD